jgi:hypothetical protein
MERGEEEASAGRCIALSDHQFCRREGPQASDERTPKISVWKFSKRARL